MADEKKLEGIIGQMQPAPTWPAAEEQPQPINAADERKRAMESGNMAARAQQVLHYAQPIQTTDAAEFPQSSFVPNDQAMQQQIPPEQVREEELQRDPYKTMYEQLSAAQKEKYDADLEKLQRRSRANEAIASVGDAGRALANLYFTTQYAPNAYSAKDDLTPKWRERYDKAQAQLKEDNAARMAYIEKLRAQRNAERAMDINEDKLELQRDRNYLYEKKLEWQQKYQQGKLDLEEIKAEADRDYKQGLLSAKGKELVIKEAKNSIERFKAYGGQPKYDEKVTKTTKSNAAGTSKEETTTKEYTPVGQGKKGKSCSAPKDW